jgi:triosephosphate isomerase
MKRHLSHISITKIPTKKKKLILALNWKMYPKTVKEARQLVGAVHTFSKKAPHVTTIVCPPSIFLPLFSTRAKGVVFGVQNIDAEIVGSKTGEVSGAQAISVGAKYVILGHAERRAQKDDTGEKAGSGETNSEIGRKMFTALTLGLTPILCVGESVRDREGKYLDFIREQIITALALLPLHLRSKIIIAYEPLYAIGAPKPPAAVDIHQSLLAIKKILLEEYGGSVARVVPLLYGGAVAGDNIRELAISIPELSGFLVGRASVDTEKFKELTKGM